MSSDPHAPTPAGPDPHDVTEVRPPAPAGDDWLTPDPVAAPSPDPLAETPSASTPLGTTEPEGPLAQAQAKAKEAQAKVTEAQAQAQTKAKQAQAQAQTQAQAISERPEAMVGLAFVGGAVASFVLKRFGR